MEKDVFDDASLQRGVDGFKNAGMDPAPNRDAIQLTIFDSWLDDFELLISADATHISHEDRYRIRRQIAQFRKRVELLISSNRSWPVESWFVVRSGVDGNELALWRRRLTRTISAPARDGAARSQPASVVLEAHADGDELTLGR